MKLNEENLDQVTGKLIRKTGTEEPSELFTERVMQSVIAFQQPKEVTNSFHYKWLFLLIPVLVSGGWYLTTFPVIMNKLLKILDSIGLYFNSVFSGLVHVFQQIGNISISPIVIIGSLAVLALLVIDAILTRKIYLSERS
jgi:hypothetical protein